MSTSLNPVLAAVATAIGMLCSTTPLTSANSNVWWRPMTGTSSLGMNVKLPDLFEGTSARMRKRCRRMRKLLILADTVSIGTQTGFIHRLHWPTEVLIFTRQIERYEGCKFSRHF